MIQVGIRELKQKTSELIRMVREEGKGLQITYHGNVVALVVPVSKKSTQEVDAAWSSLDTIAAEIGARWPTDITSVDAIVEGRS